MFWVQRVVESVQRTYSAHQSDAEMGKRRRPQRSEEQLDGGACDPADAIAVGDGSASDSSKRQATEGPFTAREVEAFIRDGFVLLKDAFSEETAAKCRELVWRRLEKDGIYKHDPSTWVERHGIAGEGTFFVLHTIMECPQRSPVGACDRCGVRDIVALLCFLLLSQMPDAVANASCRNL